MTSFVTDIIERQAAERARRRALTPMQRWREDLRWTMTKIGIAVWCIVLPVIGLLDLAEMVREGLAK